jgi:hypothetical protein
MTQFLQVMGLIISAGIGATLYMFRKGGVYNREMPSLDSLHTPTTPPQAPPVPPTAPQPVVATLPSHTALITFCTAIRDNEGGPTNINYKQNNPGNCRCSPVGYAPMYGNVRCVNNFSFFPTYELGWLYLQNLVHFRIHAHPDWTFLDFFNNYAPTGDQNDPHTYANFVAKRCGRPVDSKISSYLV